MLTTSVIPERESLRVSCRHLSVKELSKSSRSDSASLRVFYCKADVPEEANRRRAHRFGRCETAPNKLIKRSLTATLTPAEREPSSDGGVLPSLGQGFHCFCSKYASIPAKTTSSTACHGVPKPYSKYPREGGLVKIK